MPDSSRAYSLMQEVCLCGTSCNLVRLSSKYAITIGGCFVYGTGNERVSGATGSHSGGHDGFADFFFHFLINLIPQDDIILDKYVRFLVGQTLCGLRNYDGINFRQHLLSIFFCRQEELCLFLRGGNFRGYLGEVRPMKRNHLRQALSTCLLLRSKSSRLICE